MTKTHLSLDELMKGADVVHAREQFARWRDKLSASAVSAIIPVDDGIVGVRLPPISADNRFLSAWVLSKLLDSKLNGSVALSGQIGDFRTLKQFTDLEGQSPEFAVATGPSREALLAHVLSSMASFDPSRFDTDGFLK
jgi:hypothetical protein